MVHATDTDLFDRFRELGIESTTHRHPPVFTVAESGFLRGQLPGAHCKSLFLKDKKDQLWLVVALGDRQVDLKTLPKNIGAARLSFGRPEVLAKTLGVEPGSVTPFALINDAGGRVRVVLDKTMLEHDLLNYHPLKNTATTTLAAADLVRFIRSCGHDPLILDFDNLI